MSEFSERMRDIRDKEFGTDRKALYGSRGHFPLPNSYSSRKKANEYGARGTLIRNNDSSGTTNYEMVQQLTKLMSMFG